MWVRHSGTAPTQLFIRSNLRNSSSCCNFHFVAWRQCLSKCCSTPRILFRVPPAVTKTIQRLLSVLVQFQSLQLYRFKSLLWGKWLLQTARICSSCMGVFCVKTDGPWKWRGEWTSISQGVVWVLFREGLLGETLENAWTWDTWSQFNKYVQIKLGINSPRVGEKNQTDVLFVLKRSCFFEIEWTRKEQNNIKYITSFHLYIYRHPNRSKTAGLGTDKKLPKNNKVHLMKNICQ